MATMSCLCCITGSDISGGSPKRRQAAVGFVLAGLMILATAAVAADTWHGDLQGGGSIHVDPQTHRAVQDYGGVQRPAWDGVHRLDDGSTVIIREGIAVPTEQMYRAWEQGGRPEPTFAERYCDQLVRKTCGFDNACRTSAACLRARSMLTDESREQRDQPIIAGTHPQTPATAQCRDALGNPEFTPCNSLEAAFGDSHCRALVQQACGDKDRCGGSQACDAARQLLSMETEERLINDNPAAVSATGRQCIEAMGNVFFAPCTEDVSR
jgi:hypothetical protein